MVTGQSAYDPTNDKVGEVEDVLLRPDGKVSQLNIGVGGFLAMDETDVIPQDTTHQKTAPSLKDDRNTAWWVVASNARFHRVLGAPLRRRRQAASSRSRSIATADNVPA